MRLRCLAAILAAFQLARAGNFSGSIIEEHSTNPVRGARVRVKQTGAARLTADLESGFDGKFSAEIDLPPGDYNVDISKPNHTGLFVRLRVPLAEPLAVKMLRFGSISGRVADANNRPLPGASVMPMRVEGEGQYLPAMAGSTRVSSNGDYRVYGLGPGQYVVAVTWASMSGGEPDKPLTGAYLYPSNARPRIFTISSGTAVTGIDFSLPAQSEFSVSGKVTGLGEGRRAIALVLRDQPMLAVAMKQTDLDGEFRFDRVAPGAYELRAAGPTTGYAGFGAVLDSKPLFGRLAIDVGGGNVTGADVALAPGRAVKLILESTVPQCTTASVTLDALEHWGSLLYKTAEVTMGKETTVEPLAPARYRVTVTTAPEGCFSAGAAILDPDASAVRVRLVQGGSVDGKVEGKTPTVTLFDLDDTREPARVALIDRERRTFRFERLRPGRYRLVAGTAQLDVIVRTGEAANPLLRIEEKRP